MERTSARLVAAFALLLALWIGVYWLWTPARTAPADAGGVAFTGEPNVPASEPQQPDPTEQPSEEPSGETPVAAPEFRDYTAVEGDTFESIAADAYGSPNYWTVIARANPLKDPRRVSPGDTIRIPLDPGNIQGVAGDADTNPPPPTPEFIDYLVRRGDTLGGISLQFYGTTRHADMILAVNRDQLASADKLRVGQTLRVPANPPE